MKDVLIITSRSEKTVSWKQREVYVLRFCKEVEARSPDIRARFTTYQDLHFIIIDGKTRIYDTLNKIDLKDVNFVHFKNWHYQRGEAPIVASYLSAYDVPFANSEIATLSIPPGKLAQMYLLGAGGMPVPDTFYASKSALRKIFSTNKTPDGFVFPLIMKANDGSRGLDNYLIKSTSEALKILDESNTEKEYVLQNFVPNDGDYRILFMGLDNPPLVFHRKAADGNHLNNTAQGGSGNFIDASALPAEYLEYARLSAKIMKREISGVDILVNKNTNQAYVLEANGTPALATGYGVDEKIEHFAKYIEKELNLKGNSNE